MKKKKLLVIILILGFIRGNISRRIRYYFQLRLYQKYGLFVCFNGCRLLNLFKIRIKGISVKLSTGERIFIDETVIQVAPRCLFNKDVFKSLLSAIDINKVSITSPKKVSTHVNKFESQQATITQYFIEKRVYDKFQKYLRLFFSKRYPMIKISELKTSIWVRSSRLDSQMHNVNVEYFLIKASSIFCLENLQAVFHFEINGDILNKGVRFHANNVVFLDKTTGSNIAKFDSLELVHKDIDSSTFSIEFIINAVHLNKKTISNSIVVLEKVNANLQVRLNSESFEVLKESTIAINDIYFTLNILHSLKDPDLIKFSILFLLEGESFFQNYPFILKEFNTLRGVGDMLLKVEFMTSLQDLSQYYFQCKVLEDNLTIVDIYKFTLADLCHQPNSNLIQRAEIESFLSTYTDTNEFCSGIPELIKHIVVLTEDPNFYSHTGIDPYFIGIAISVNLSSKRILKGASTITMQLVKNLFFNHSRSFNRKIDELIIAWLLENHFKISKTHILELYLKIIEFGDNVFGIEAASEYYFDKDISLLNLTESLVLSYIIPRPNFFLEAVLLNSKKLKLNLRKHIASCAYQLLRLNKITDEEFSQLNYCIKFKSTIGVLQL